VIVAITLDGIAVARMRDMLSREKAAPGTVWWLLFGAFFLICSLFWFEEHRAHVLGALPYLLGLAALMFCIFGHRHAGTWRTHDEHGGAR
jgi:drug/metabolite transporter (DMT)-like permease